MSDATSDDELQASLAEWAVERERQRQERIRTAKTTGDRYRAIGLEDITW